MPEKLKPCPFCGELDALIMCLEDGIFFEQCANCGSRGPAEYTKTGALNSWNERCSQS